MCIRDRGSDVAYYLSNDEIYDFEVFNAYYVLDEYELFLEECEKAEEEDVYKRQFKGIALKCIYIRYLFYRLIYIYMKINSWSICF